jgi:tetratricopeptide (TPR) repeat protein
VLGLLFLNQTITRNGDWRDNETIFRATLAENPDTLRVHSNLAVTYDFLQGNYPGAARHYKAAIALYEKQKVRTDTLLPDEIPLRLSLAEMLLRQENYSDAMEWYGSLMPLTQQENMKADGAKAAFGLGQCYLGLGNYTQATQLMQQAITLDPNLAGRFRDLMRGAPLPGPR